MFRTEQGQIIRPTEITTSREGLFRVGVGLERVSELVTDVEVNPQAKDRLPRKYRYLANPDFWREQVVLSVPFGVGQTKRMSPLSWGRAVPVGYGSIPYGNFVGGSLMLKGVFRTGSYYRGHNLQMTSYDLMPVGFFGHKDAKKEIEIGNALLEVGFRGSLPLANLYFDTQKMREFLLGRWRTFPGLLADIDLCFDILEKNADVPVALGRLTGVQTRWDNFLSYRKGVADYRRTNELVWASQLWLAEMNQFPQQFNRYLVGWEDLNSERVRLVLEKLARRQGFTKDELIIFTEVMVGILGYNARCLRRGVGTSQILSQFSNLGVILGAWKDNCLALICQDYEEAREGPLPVLFGEVFVWRGYTRSFGTPPCWVDGKVAGELLQPGVVFDGGLVRLTTELFSTELERLACLK